MAPATHAENGHSHIRTDEQDILKVLFTADHIHERVKQLGRKISADFAGEPVVLVGVLSGAFIFLADLARAVTIPASVDCLRAKSYGEGTVTSGSVDLTLSLKSSVAGKHIVLVEDIVDTGHTITRLLDGLAQQGAQSVSLCALLDKPSRREVPVKLPSGGRQYIGFECPNEFVVGYGLDFAERYRTLPYIGVLKPSCYG